VWEPFSREAVLAEVKAVIAGEDYDSVVGEVKTPELVADFSYYDVDAVNEAIIIPDGFLEFFGGGETNVPSASGFGSLEEFGQSLEKARISGQRRGDGDILIKVFISAVGDELAGVVILDVGGLEIYGEAEGFFLRAAIQEFGYLVAEYFGEVLVVSVPVFSFVW